MIFPTDILVIVGLVLVGTGFSFFIGKSKAVAIILAFLFAIPLFQAFPFTKQMTVATGALPQALNVLAIFLAFVILMFLLLNKYIVGDFIEGNFLKSVFLGIAFAAIVLTLSHFILPLDSLYNFGPNIDTWFGGNLGLFWWIVTPLVIVFFV